MIKKNNPIILKKRNILLLIDNNKNRKLLIDFLVDECVIDTEIKKMYYLYDLILLDKKNFREHKNSLKSIKENNSIFLPVIFLTSDNIGKFYNHMENLVEDIIKIPVKKKILNMRIKNLLKMKRLWDQTKTLQEKYSGIFNSINDAVFIHGINDSTNNKYSNFIEVNNEACTRLGYTREQFMKMGPEDIDNPQFINKVFPEIYIQLQKKGTATFETEHITKEGKKIPVEINAHIMNFNGNRVVVSVARDISERKKREKKLKNSLKESKELTSQMRDLISLANYLSKSALQRNDLFLSDLLHTAMHLIPKADYGSVSRYTDNKWELIDAKGYSQKLLKQVNMKRDYLYNLDQKYSEKGVIKIKNVNIEGNLNQQIRSNLTLIFKKIKESLYININLNNDQHIRVSLDIATANKAEFDKSDQKTMKAFKNLISSFFIIKDYNNMQEQFQGEIILSMIRVLEIHDNYTKGHSENVANISKELAAKLNLSSEKIKDAYWAGMVHDIGKILISKDILNKPERLNKKEYKKIKKHPQYAYEVLKNTQQLKTIAKYVLYHHERCDGSGYPEGLRGDEIPLISRIIGVADTWDAMTSDRSYRKALPETKALKIIEDNDNKQFCPEVVKAFIKLYNVKKYN